MARCLDKFGRFDPFKNGDDHATGGAPVKGASSTWEADSIPGFTYSVYWNLKQIELQEWDLELVCYSCYGNSGRKALR